MLDLESGGEKLAPGGGKKNPQREPQNGDPSL